MDAGTVRREVVPPMDAGTTVDAIPMDAGKRPREGAIPMDAGNSVAGVIPMVAGTVFREVVPPMDAATTADAIPMDAGKRPGEDAIPMDAGNSVAGVTRTDAGGIVEGVTRMGAGRTAHLRALPPFVATYPLEVLRRCEQFADISVVEAPHMMSAVHHCIEELHLDKILQFEI